MQQGQDLERGISQVHNPSPVRPSKVHVHTAPRCLPQAPHCSPRDAQYTRQGTLPLQTGWGIHPFFKTHSLPQS